MELTKEDIEFQSLLDQKRHKEIIVKMTAMLKELSKLESDPKIVVDTTKIENVLKTLNSSSDLKNIPSSIKAIGDVLSKKIDDIINKKTPTEWIHTIKRDKKGRALTIISKSK